MTYESICEDAGKLLFTNTTNIIASIIKASKQKSLMKVVGPSGSGKTTALKALRPKLPGMCVVTVYAGMTKKQLLEELAIAIEIRVLPKTANELIRAIKEELHRVKKLICIDEANFLSETSLEQLRHIHDECEVAMVLLGSEALEYMIAKSHPQVDTRIRPSLPVTKFGKAEVKALAHSMLVEIDDKQALRLWKRCRNLREVEYWLEDFKEIYMGNMEHFEEALG